MVSRSLQDISEIPVIKYVALELKSQVYLINLVNKNNL